MNKLLIIGSGEHGHVVRVVAEAIGIYDEIAFADDRDPSAVGTIDEAELLHSRFDSAFVAIGNNTVREKITGHLMKIGYDIPILIHPTAYVSPSAQIEAGTVIEPLAAVNTRAKIGVGCIVSMGALIDHNAVIEPFVHVNTGAVVKGGGRVKTSRKLEAGEIVFRDRH